MIEILSLRWYNRNSIDISDLLTQAGSVLLATAARGGDIETVCKQLESGVNVNYQNKVNNIPSLT